VPIWAIKARHLIVIIISIGPEQAHGAEARQTGGDRLTHPLVAEILAEWTMSDDAFDLGQWHEGLSRFESETAAAHGGLDDAAELMCAGLTHFVAGKPLTMTWASEPSETALARTIWDVLAVIFADRADGLSDNSARQLRLALAAVRQCGYQPQDLGGNGFMSGFFDAGNRERMTLALCGAPGVASTGATISLPAWFSPAVPASPQPNVPALAATTWNSVKNTARQAQQHANPVLLHHGMEAVQDALIESKVAKVDRKTGKLKVRKLGVAKAAIRPGQTVRKAIDGAAVGDRLKSYGEAVGTLPPASSAEEFAGYPSKRDFLRDWARRLIVAAKVSPTVPLTDSYATAAADGICSEVFIPFGTSRGISNSGQYFHPDPVPDGTMLEIFDDLYRKVAPSDAERQAVDKQIVAFLNSCRAEWTRSLRQQPG